MKAVWPHITSSLQCACSGMKCFSSGFSNAYGRLRLPQPQSTGDRQVPPREQSLGTEPTPSLCWDGPQNLPAAAAAAALPEGLQLRGELHFGQEARFEGMATGFKNRLSFFLKPLQFPHSRRLWGRGWCFSIFWYTWQKRSDKAVNKQASRHIQVFCQDSLDKHFESVFLEFPNKMK